MGIIPIDDRQIDMSCDSRIRRRIQMIRCVCAVLPVGGEFVSRFLVCDVRIQLVYIYTERETTEDTTSWLARVIPSRLTYVLRSRHLHTSVQEPFNDRSPFSKCALRA